MRLIRTAMRTTVKSSEYASNFPAVVEGVLLVRLGIDFLTICLFRTDGWQLPSGRGRWVSSHPSGRTRHLHLEETLPMNAKQLRISESSG
jgi:hypothetical protein